MSMIPDEIIEQVKDATDISSLMGEAVDLKRTGSDWRGRCPFHGGTHRNFAVIPKKGRYYCFVCHEAGDVFSYMMKRFGMDYPTAVREAGPQGRHRRPGEAAACRPRPERAAVRRGGGGADWFAHRLLESAEAGAPAPTWRAGIALEVAAPHGLGYAPSGGAFLEAMGSASRTRCC